MKQTALGPENEFFKNFFDIMFTEDNRKETITGLVLQKRFNMLSGELNRVKTMVGQEQTKKIEEVFEIG